MNRCRPSWAITLLLAVVLLPGPARAQSSSAGAASQTDRRGPATSEGKNTKVPVGKGYLLFGIDTPSGTPLSKTLTRQDRIDSFEALAEAIDKCYTTFEIKGIRDWPAVVARYRARLDEPKDADEFYLLLFQLINELHDSHSWIHNWRPRQLDASPHLHVEPFGDQAIVTEVPPGSEAEQKGIRPGSEIVSVDGLSIRTRLKQIEPYLRQLSSDRATKRRAYAWLLSGSEDTRVGLHLRTPEGRDQRVELTRTQGQWFQSRSQRRDAFDVTRLKFLQYGVHPSGMGYIRISSFMGRQEISDEFDRALDALRDTPGLIVDVRGNPGGSGASQSHIVGRFVQARTLGAITHTRDPRKPDTVTKREIAVSPAGAWQYRGPVVLLVDEDTGSAADLFTCLMIHAGRVTAVGTTTHGNLSGNAAFAFLPCGLVVRISPGFICDPHGVPIERNGNVPQVAVTPTVEDLLKGRDATLETGIELLKRKIRNEAIVASAAQPAVSPSGDPTPAVPKPSSDLPALSLSPDTPASRADSRVEPKCDPITGECLVPIPPEPRTTTQRSSDRARASEYDQIEPLDFALDDAYGRQIRAGDFLGAPSLVLVGACWCGGCQADADTLHGVEQKYRPRGLQIIRCTAWDNELPAWEFVKHYRLGSVPLQDPDRNFERRYNRNGWTFVMLADSSGKVVYRANRVRWPEVEARIESLLPKQPSKNLIERNGAFYPPAVLYRSGEMDRARPRDAFPTLACADDGRIYVAFTSDRQGTQDVFLRVFDGHQWLLDQPVAATQADEFDGTVIVDRRNRPWVGWTSNAGGPKYDVYAACMAETASVSSPIRITRSEDDAMHVRLTIDAQDRLWATYYEWGILGDRSRDKEVYARCLDGDGPTKAIHISPEDVPSYEDHTDPVAVASGDSLVFAWSWDFHTPDGYPRTPQNPTIFVRKMGPTGTLERARAVSNMGTDTRPALAAAPDGRLWCAWESAGISARKKQICFTIEDLNGPENPRNGTALTGLMHNVCTPCLAFGPSGQASLVWAQADDDNRWSLMHAVWNAGAKSWATPKPLVTQGDPRFPSAAYAKDGALWVAYSIQKDGGRTIECRPFPDPSARR